MTPAHTRREAGGEERRGEGESERYGGREREPCLSLSHTDPV